MCSSPSQFHMIYRIDVIIRLGFSLPGIICACLQVYMFRCLCIMSHDFYELFFCMFFFFFFFFNPISVVRICFKLLWQKELFWMPALVFLTQLF